MMHRREVMRTEFIIDSLVPVIPCGVYNSVPHSSEMAFVVVVLAAVSW